MKGEGPLSGIARAMEELRRELASPAEGVPREREVLMAVFRLNNEIGAAAKKERTLKPMLVELQLRVNLVTIEVKRGNVLEAVSALAEAERLTKAL